ncbi:MAG: hypothetical protein LRY69_05690 [Gammaproteobacteria bacterium]|nr:hypothetical protein [Gammaproteobacteria bacterium]
MSLSYNVSENLIRDLIKNQKRDRFWRNCRFFYWIAFFSVAFFFVLHGLPTKVHEKPEKPYVALVRLNGFISTESAFSAEKVLPQLQAAFSDKEAKGVVIVINSGGGSPVQASIIQEKIVQLKKQYHKKVDCCGRRCSCFWRVSGGNGGR